MNHLKKMKRFVIASVLSLSLLSSVLLCSCNGKPAPDVPKTNESEQLSQQESEKQTERDTEQLTEQKPVANLKYGKKYFTPGSINKDKTDIYFIFREDGTGVYHYYEDFILYGEQQNTSYEIQFVYEIVDGIAVCFFDSLKMDPADNTTNADRLTSWYTTLEFSNDIIFRDKSLSLICEDYLSRIPNFGK